MRRGRRWIAVLLLLALVAGGKMEHEAPGPVLLHAPPGVEVEIALNGYPMSGEFGIPASKKIIVPAGGHERVDFDLPAGETTKHDVALVSR